MSTNFSSGSLSRISFSKNRLLQILVITFVALWFIMYCNCIDKTDWFIENILVFLFAIYLTVSYRSFKFSDASYICFFLFLMLHIFGAQYAYTKNPVGGYLQETFQLWRNPYDRIVHFSFGLFLAYPLRDILINKVKVKGRWQYLLPIEIILSLACTFELIEWLVSEFTTKETGETYVATQGDVWDAHKDIAVAFVGAAITMATVYLYNRKRNIKV